MVNTPSLLKRLLLAALGAQVLLVWVVSVALPGGASFLTVVGLVTREKENPPLTVKVVPIPLTDPTVYASVQSLLLMLVFALLFAGLAGLVKTNPWQHGALPNSTPPGRDTAPPPQAPASPPPAAGPSASGPPPPGPATQASGPGPSAADGTPRRQPPRSAPGPAGT